MQCFCLTYGWFTCWTYLVQCCWKAELTVEGRTDPRQKILLDPCCLDACRSATDDDSIVLAYNYSWRRPIDVTGALLIDSAVAMTHHDALAVAMLCIVLGRPNGRGVSVAQWWLDTCALEYCCGCRMQLGAYCRLQRCGISADTDASWRR